MPHHTQDDQIPHPFRKRFDESGKFDEGWDERGATVVYTSKEEIKSFIAQELLTQLQEIREKLEELGKQDRLESSTWIVGYVTSRLEALNLLSQKESELRNTGI